ncbi:MAG: ADP-ribosylglycohydrolase family protein [Myxococcaceae bacterium]
MPLHIAVLQDRFRAAVLGFAIGDALGFPLRGLPAPALSRQTLPADDFAARPRGGFPRGQFSDDTQMMMAVADAVVREKRIDGRVAAQHLSWLWQEGTVLQPPPSATQSAEKLLAGTPWMSAGAPLGVTDPSSLSRGVVVGLSSEPMPTRLAHDAQVLTVMTHKDPLCAAAVAAFARAVQLGLSGEGMTAEEFCEQISHAAAPHSRELADELFYLPRALEWDADRALLALRRVGVPPTHYDFELGVPAHVTPVLLTGLYAFLKAPTDFRAAMQLVLRGGGEVDVTAGVCGAVAGAHLGSEAIPQRLRKNVMYAEALVEVADRLFDVKLARVPVVTSAFATVKR